MLRPHCSPSLEIMFFFLMLIREIIPKWPNNLGLYIPVHTVHTVHI